MWAEFPRGLYVRLLLYVVQYVYLGKLRQARGGGSYMDCPRQISRYLAGRGVGKLQPQAERFRPWTEGLQVYRKVKRLLLFLLMLSSKLKLSYKIRGNSLFCRLIFLIFVLTLDL